MTNQPTVKEIHELLGEEMSYKWRVQSFSKKNPSATCVAYIDSRDVQNRLDEVIGPDRWQDDYKEIKGNLYAGIGIKINNEWVWKWDCGVESNQDAQKGEASDSFKRAAVKWNIGRFLYNLPIKYVKANEVKTNGSWPFCVDDSGQKIWDLTAHVNGMDQNPKHTKGAVVPEVPKSKLKPLIEGTESFKRCVGRLKAGYPIEDLHKVRLISPEIEAKLIEESNKVPA